MLKKGFSQSPNHPWRIFARIPVSRLAKKRKFRHAALVDKKQKLELTWILEESDEIASPHIRLEFPEDPENQDSPIHCRELALAFCPQPRCGCFTIEFDWLPISESTSGASVSRSDDICYSLNENSCVINPEVEKDSEIRRVSEVINSELSETNRCQLREWFFAAKQECIRTTPIEEMDLGDLPEADKMIIFSSVFPLASPLSFRWRDEDWIVEEQYCVQPRCDCNITTLTFIKKQVSLIKLPPSARYDYVTETVKRELDGLSHVEKAIAKMSWSTTSLTALVDALKLEHPDLNAQFESRHKILKALYARHHRELAKEQLAASFPQATKPGRNEPCPCGSGRKFKQCCMNKPLP